MNGVIITEVPPATVHYQDDAVTIHHGNALNLPLEDASVDLVVTSPPYFGLRSYQDSGEHYAGQIGSEATPGEFLDALIATTAEMVRVLKPSGSLFVNLGDKYASGDGSGTQRGLEGGVPAVRGNGHQRGSLRFGVPSKSLLLIPERYRIRCIDELGLIARAVICWSKPNGLPESVTDRVRRSHEDWVHLTKEPRYFSAVDEIREGYEGKPQRRGGTDHQVGEYAGLNKQTLRKQWDEPQAGTNPLGKLPGSVWEIPTQPLTVPDHLGVDHFAAFPLEWPLRIIRGWSPSGICTVCGDGRRPVVDRGESSWDRRKADGDPMRYGLMGTAAPLQRSLSDAADRAAGGFGVPATKTLTGYACACPDTTAPTRPAIILDPFAGTGTTLLAAKALGRLGIGNDLSADYCRLAQWRCTDPGELAKAMRVEKPAPVIDGQTDLLDALS